MEIHVLPLHMMNVTAAGERADQEIDPETEEIVGHADLGLDHIPGPEDIDLDREKEIVIKKRIRTEKRGKREKRGASHWLRKTI